MNRKEFIIRSCTVCIGATALGSLLGSCTASKFVGGNLDKDGLLVDLKEFHFNEKNKYRRYIVVRNEALLFPICVYRFSDKEYSAVWMQCSHQGAELNVADNYLQCPAHGSEFNNKGKVASGPADRDLRTFPTEIRNNQLFIDLRKV